MDKWWETVVSKYISMGSRGHNLRLPPVWSRGGVYEVLPFNRPEALRQKFVPNSIVALPRLALEQISDICKVSIDMNCSEARAVLHGGGLVQPLRCAKLMDVREPLQARKRMCRKTSTPIEDIQRPLQLMYGPPRVDSAHDDDGCSAASLIGGASGSDDGSSGIHAADAVAGDVTPPLARPVSGTVVDDQKKSKQAEVVEAAFVPPPSGG